MKKAIVFLMLLSSSFLQAQDNYNHAMLDLMDTAVRKVYYQDVARYIIRKNFMDPIDMFGEPTPDSAGRKSYHFLTAVRNLYDIGNKSLKIIDRNDYSINVIFNKLDRIVSIEGKTTSRQNFDLGEKAIKNKDFIIIETKKVKNNNDVMVDINRWAKEGFPFHIVTNHQNLSIGFISSKQKDF